MRLCVPFCAARVSTGFTVRRASVRFVASRAACQWRVKGASVRRQHGRVRASAHAYHVLCVDFIAPITGTYVLAVIIDRASGFQWLRRRRPQLQLGSWRLTSRTTCGTRQSQASHPFRIFLRYEPTTSARERTGCDDVGNGSIEGYVTSVSLLHLLTSIASLRCQMRIDTRG